MPSFNFQHLRFIHHRPSKFANPLHTTRAACLHLIQVHSHHPQQALHTPASIHCAEALRRSTYPTSRWDAAIACIQIMRAGRPAAASTVQSLGHPAGRFHRGEAPPRPANPRAGAGAGFPDCVVYAARSALAGSCGRLWCGRAPLLPPL